MFRHVPNALTGSRLVLAVVFFVLLSFYQHDGRGDPWLLDIAFAAPAAEEPSLRRALWHRKALDGRLRQASAPSLAGVGL